MVLSCWLMRPSGWVLIGLILFADGARVVKANELHRIIIHTLVENHAKYIRAESKKQDIKLLSIYSPDVDRLSKSFHNSTSTLNRKYEINSSLNASPHHLVKFCQKAKARQQQNQRTRTKGNMTAVEAWTDTTLCPKKVSPLNILQQQPQTCTDLNEILHTQDDTYFCHRRQVSEESLTPFTRF